MANEAPSAVTTWQHHGVVTQSLELRPQLDAGIRVLDIRARHIGNSFAIHHGAYYVNANFGQVLGTVVQFLRDHPTETVLMRIKEEHEPEQVTRSFAATFEAYRDQPAYTQFIWRGMAIPNLGEVRGKIVIIDDFSGGTYGIRWGALSIQDVYTEIDMDVKSALVRDHLGLANAGTTSTTYVNFLGAAGSDF